MDFASLLYSSPYLILGTTATLTVVNGQPVTVTAIDKTSGVETGEKTGVLTIRPAAVVRMSELTAAGIARVNLPKATLVLNGSTWIVQNTLQRPGPTGTASGELYLFLSEPKNG